jgi:hypothetical protein
MYHSISHYIGVLLILEIGFGLLISLAAPYIFQAMTTKLPDNAPSEIQTLSVANIDSLTAGSSDGLIAYSSNPINTRIRYDQPNDYWYGTYATAQIIETNATFEGTPEKTTRDWSDTITQYQGQGSSGKVGFTVYLLIGQELLHQHITLNATMKIVTIHTSGLNEFENVGENWIQNINLYVVSPQELSSRVVPNSTNNLSSLWAYEIAPILFVVYIIVSEVYGSRIKNRRY